MEGLPLGIELAAASLWDESPRQVAEAIERNLDALATTMQDVPARHRSLRAAFNHSWDLLADEERHVFRRLPVFRGGFEREAAAQVAGATRFRLKALEDKSLLRRADSGRYEMHALLRKYVAEKLEEEPREEERIRRLHRYHYLMFLSQKEDHLKGKRQAEALGEIRTEIENVRAAWQHAVDRGERPKIEQALESLHLFYQMRSWFQEGQKAFAGAVKALGPDRAGEEAGLSGKLLARQGVFCYHLGLQTQARKLLQRGLEISQMLDASKGSARC